VINESGNLITMSVVVDDDGVTVLASGPTSEVEHTWTPLEARELIRLLTEALTPTPTERVTRRIDMDAIVGEAVDGEAVFELDEMLEDHKTESMTFLRDDVGDWFVRINSDLGYCSAAQWRHVDQDFAELLDTEHDRTRLRE